MQSSTVFLGGPGIALAGKGGASPFITGSDVAVYSARRAATVLLVLLSAFMSSTTDDGGNYAAGVDAQR